MRSLPTSCTAQSSVSPWPCIGNTNIFLIFMDILVGFSSIKLRGLSLTLWKSAVWYLRPGSSLKCVLQTWQCATDLTMFYRLKCATDLSVLQTWQCAAYLTVCYRLDSVLQTWQCATDLTVCYRLDSVLHTWQCAADLTVCYRFDSMLQIWQCGTDLTVCYRLDSVLQT